jgi:DNA-binding GntR family transcriptional regulator
MTNSGTIFQKLQPVSKKMRVVMALKEAILSGSLQPGDQIVEGKLAQQLGVGQGLVREALIDLEHQGFVQRSPFSWTQVTTFSNEDVNQIFEIRIEVEPLAFTLAGQKVNPEQLAELRELVVKAKEGATAGDLAVFFENHLAYRRRVWDLSGNRFLRETLERLVAPLYALYLMRANFNREGLLQTIQDCIVHQEETMRAFDAGKPGEAAAIVRKFLQQMKDSLGSKLLPIGTNQ